MPGLRYRAKDFIFISLRLLDQHITQERRDFYTEDIIKHYTNIYEKTKKQTTLQKNTFLVGKQRFTSFLLK